MKNIALACLLVLLIATSQCQAQLTVTTEIINSVEFTSPPRVVGNRVLYDPKTKKGESVIAWLTIDGHADVVDVTAARLMIVDGKIVSESAKVESDETGRIFAITGTGTYTVEVVGYRTGRIERYPKYDVALTAKKPEPKPDDPPPKPDDPPQPEVKSFRVIFVKESGSTLSSEQTAITGAKAVRDYLTQRTTPEGGLAGWREYDPQQNVNNEQATMRALWGASKSSIAKVPCLIVEVNGKVKLLDYPKNVPDAIKIFKEYGGQ